MDFKYNKALTNQREIRIAANKAALEKKKKDLED